MRTKEQIQSEIDKIKSFIDENTQKRIKWIKDHQDYEDSKIGEIKAILESAGVYEKVKAIDDQRFAVKSRLSEIIKEMDSDVQAVFMEMKKLEEEMETAPTALELKKQRYAPITDALYKTDPRTKAILDKIAGDQKDEK